MEYNFDSKLKFFIKNGKKTKPSNIFEMSD